MKKIVLIILFVITALSASDVMVVENSYEVLKLDKRVKEISVGDKNILNLNFIDGTDYRALKIFGKTCGDSSVLILYGDGSYESVHVYVNKNISYLQKSIEQIAPNAKIELVGNTSLTLSGAFEDMGSKKKVLKLIENSHVDSKKLVDISKVKQINKMVRTKLYLVEINNQRAKDLGGITGLGILNKNIAASINPKSSNGATFSGYLLDNAGEFTAKSGFSIVGALNFLEEKGVAKILDDTVLMTTEDKNATFHVGGEVYIPIGLTQNDSGLPTIQLAEKEYGLKLTLTTNLLEKNNFLMMNIDIEDSQFDTDDAHNVQLGEFTEVPAFVSKRITTEILAQNEQVVALGGRLHSEEVKDEEKVPLLGDIPVVGEAFKHNTKSLKSNDILFFLVPTIVDPNEGIDDSKFYQKNKEESFEMGKKLTLIEEKKVEQNKEVEVKAKITAKKVFIRSSAVDGIVVDVWKEGHEFIPAQMSDLSLKNWIRIEQDCFGGECFKLESDFWVSKSATNL